jgi:hypothetical protein
MRRLLCACSLLLLIVVSARAQEKGALAPGDNVPATFHPYNVNARITVAAEPDEKGKGEAPASATAKGRYHCLITEYDLDPVVMIVARNLDDSAGLHDLLKKIDGAIDRNPVTRLRCFVVALYDDLTEVVTQDDKRNELIPRLEKMAEDLKLKGVVVTLAAPVDVEKFKLDDKAALNAVLYEKLRVVAVHNVAREKLDKEGGPEAKAILDDVAGKLKASR